MTTKLSDREEFEESITPVNMAWKRFIEGKTSWQDECKQAEQNHFDWIESKIAEAKRECLEEVLNKLDKLFYQNHSTLSEARNIGLAEAQNKIKKLKSLITN